MLPQYPPGNRVYIHHMILVRTLLDGFGVANPSVFEAKLKKVG
jgi:hypothetical protein